ncbi:YceI family protein [Fluviispira multicolorata]|uniref:Lipid/polyisoprenoid-binding YceI-like domain-containing protein n=1 Tax=Fluviispira multicolorata TaxID=2654512 RepID=A0A833N5A3_9BACT|nr:YceI family protein [Fluviispira multicolorata]KAB8033622.1 hypothetical protein GCL57_02635 [Fluviispira multicolorata]
MIISKFTKLFLISTFFTLPYFVFAQNKEEKYVAIAETAKKYEIDNSHSSVSFEIAHLVISTATGKFKRFQGHFKFNPKDFTKTELEATADVASVDTDNTQRDEHLKKEDFFDAEKYPTMTFKSTSAKKTGANTFDLTGDINIRGVKKTVTFNITYNGELKSKAKEIVAFKGTTKINRKDFGINYNKIVEATATVGDIVTININCEGVIKL